MKRLALFLLLSCVAPPASAWGREAHRIIAQLAQRQLRPDALAESRRLLAGEAETDLPGISNWADELRRDEHGGASAAWHYVNFHGGDCEYVPPRDCPDGRCVIAQIDRQFLVLSDRARPDAERRDALKFLVHLVGDVHQPLHASATGDRGGNDYQVSLAGKGTNLHAVWDREIVAARGLDPQAYAALLASQPPLPADPTAHSDRPAIAWAVESCRLVRDGGLYPDGHRIGPDYLLAHQAQAELRMRQAGQRLADMLNVALAPRAHSEGHP